MRHSTLHIISREQNKYIALKNHQNTISFGVVFILWHTKANIFQKEIIFSGKSGLCVWSKRKEVFYTDGNQRSVHLSTPFKQTFDFQSKETRSKYKISWLSSTNRWDQMNCLHVHDMQGVRTQHVHPYSTATGFKLGHLQCLCEQLLFIWNLPPQSSAKSVFVSCYTHLKHDASLLMHPNSWCKKLEYSTVALDSCIKRDSPSVKNLHHFVSYCVLWKSYFPFNLD